MEDLKSLAEALEKMDKAMLKAEIDFCDYVENVHPYNRNNARNLLHYLDLRNLDIRDIQDRLHAAGLSSMASSESHIRGQLLAICQHLGLAKEINQDVYSYGTASLSLAAKSAAIFGRKKGETIPFIMVTLDGTMADDYGKIKNLLQSGMNIARINCAHDEESTWFRMIQHIKRASRITGLDCKIYMDLAGPKIRTIIRKGDKLKVQEGQSFYLTDEQNVTDDEETIGCTVSGIAEQLNPGEIVLFDDGLIEARVEKTGEGKAKLQVVRISAVCLLFRSMLIWWVILL